MDFLFEFPVRWWTGNSDWLKLYKLSIKLSEWVARGDKLFSPQCSNGGLSICCPRWDIRPRRSFSIWTCPVQHVVPRPRLHPSPSTLITVLRQVVFGLPRFLLPGGVHLRATFGIRSWSILSTCPSHRMRRRLISSTTLWHLVFL